MRKLALAAIAMASMTAWAAEDNSTLLHDQELTTGNAVVNHISFRADSARYDQLTLKCVDKQDWRVDHAFVATETNTTFMKPGWGTVNLFIDGVEHTAQAYVDPDVYSLRAQVDIWPDNNMTDYSGARYASRTWLVDKLSQATQQVAWEIEYQGYTTELQVVTLDDDYQELFTNFKLSCVL